MAARSKIYRYTFLAMNVLEKILGSKIKVRGLENVPSKPVLFVANHFTRSETFIIPYVISKYSKRQVRCLADSGLFFGALGRFLESVGTVSTKDKNRDKKIINDLINADYDWMIYPEGNMVKNKKISANSLKSHYYFQGALKSVRNKVKTGSAILALKSQIYRNYLLKAHQENDSETIDFYKKHLGLELKDQNISAATHIVPVNITYYPIRPGSNIIKKFADKIIKKMPKQIAEELEIEGNLLMSANINVSFGRAINLNQYIKNSQNIIDQIPIIKSATKANLLLKYFKYPLTKKFMDAVYSGTLINIDHLLVAILYFYPEEEILASDLKEIIFLSACQIEKSKKYDLDEALNLQNVINLLSEKENKALKDVLELAKNQKIISKKSDKITINRHILEKTYDFHKIRVQNTLQVVLNEFLLLKNAVNIVKFNINIKESKRQKLVFKYIFDSSVKEFDQDYEKYYDEDLSKDKNIGQPFFFDAPARPNGQKIGILMVHGYLSAPRQMQEAAEYFNGKGFATYVLRLKGHGTAPHNLEDVNWQDWFESANASYIALKAICDKVFLFGFSTGGLLSLLLAAKNKQIDGLVCVNPALKLQDMRAKFSSGVCLWNDLLQKLKIDKGQLRYVENKSEDDDINYSRNYVKAIDELGDLMGKCYKNLKNISCPILLVQSDQDPIVNPQGAKVIIEKVSSKNKNLRQVSSEKHNILKGRIGEDLFDQVKSYFLKI